MKKSLISQAILTSVAMGAAFNAESFLNQVTEEKTQDSVIPHPEGDFEGNIDDLRIKSGTSKESGKTWVKAVAKIRCLDQQETADSGLDELLAYDEFFLDLTEDNGLDMGGNKNVALGKLRSASGLNESGQEFSLAMLKNKTIGYTVKHRMQDNGEPRAYVAAVYAIEEE